MHCASTFRRDTKKNGRLLSLRRARRRLRRGGRTRQLRVLNAEDGPEATPQLFRQRVQINRTLAWRVARAGLVRGARRAGGGAIEPKLNVGEWEPPTEQILMYDWGNNDDNDCFKITPAADAVLSLVN